MRQPSTQNVKNILDSDLTDLKANILQDPQIAKAVSGVVDPEVINKIMIPKIIMTKYPHLSEDEVEEVREHLVADMVIRGSNIKTNGNRSFIDMSGKFVNLDELNIDLIDSINPFQQAFEVISKSITPKVLKSIQECIAAGQFKYQRALIQYYRVIPTPHPVFRLCVHDKGRELFRLL